MSTLISARTSVAAFDNALLCSALNDARTALLASYSLPHLPNYPRQAAIADARLFLREAMSHARTLGDAQCCGHILRALRAVSTLERGQ